MVHELLMTEHDDLRHNKYPPPGI